MSQKLKMTDADRAITNKAIENTPQEKLVSLFGARQSYEIPNYLSIAAISNKATYKLDEEEHYYLEARAKLAYKLLKSYYTRRAEHKLGFNFNENFGIVKEDKFNLQSLSDFEDSVMDQTQHIPLSQETFDKIISSKKYKASIENSNLTNIEKSGRSIEYYLCEVDGQVVPIAFLEKQAKIWNTEPERFSQSLSVFILLQGKVPFFVSRLDFEPFNKHTNRLENGEITMKKIRSTGTHQHLYSERFAVLVPTKERIMHADATSIDFLPSFEEAKKYVLNQINASQERNKKLEEIFINDLKKAQKKKKYKSKKINQDDFDFVI